jgi:periplasmic copper chaperone A
MRAMRGARRWVPAAAIATLVALWPTTAWAHVTVSPTSAPRDSTSLVLSFQVPDELPAADVVGLRIQLPTAHPIASVTPEATTGWAVTTKLTTLAHPVKTDDGTFTQVVSEIDWSGGVIRPGQFGAFDVLVEGLPSDTGQLVFHALQQYSNGQTVAWIEQPSKGDPNPQHPAPTLTLTTRSSTSGASGGSNPGGTAAGSGGSGGSGGSTLTASAKSSNWLAVVALIVAGFAVALSLMVLWLTRPSMRLDPLVVPEGADDD